MTTIGGIDLAAGVLRIFKGADMTLRRIANGAAKADINAGFEQTSVDHPCKGYEGSRDFGRIPSSLVRQGMVVFGIYGASLDVTPVADDQVIYGGVTHVVYHVEGGRSGAVWVVYACAVTG